MRYLQFILAILPIAAEAICKDPPCPRPEPTDPGPECAPADRCGTACCKGEIFARLYCANRAKNLCCPQGTIEVGNTGRCCFPGQILLGGTTCCPPRSILCGGKCCVGTCDPTSLKCRSTITNQECKALGWEGACATTPKSKSCFGCDDLGCCTDWVG